MTTASSRIIFNVELPKDYENRIEAAIADELKVAQRKWGLELDDEALEVVTKRSKEQLVDKANVSMKTHWEFGPTMSFKVKGLTRQSTGKLSKDLSIPADVKKVEGLQFLLTREGFSLESNGDDFAFTAEEIPEFITAKLETWARTAVFYGVGSYRN